ncbi:MAG: isoprenylcysteine carboxylmethyltransferase family protein [Candidatus Omnitrophica bacterium]|nr:isoprenylcysteine carboxylmethyltransferase family protein [Candidatus Omnitrophota bacterium]
MLPLIGALPWWLHRRFEGPWVWHNNFWQWLGLWLIANGVGLAGWCVNLFNVAGQGTPAPFDPPTQFVASGPYRYVRNPMMLGMFLILGGEVALYQSRAVWIYTLVLMAGAYSFVRFWEEPELERRFGEAYREYKRRVPRWIPRPPRR